MSDPKSFAAARATRSGNNLDWTVRDCLVELLRQLDNGEETGTRVLVMLVKDDDEGDGFTVTNWRANLTGGVESELLMMRMYKHMQWRLG